VLQKGKKKLKAHGSGKHRCEHLLLTGSLPQRNLIFHELRHSYRHFDLHIVEYLETTRHRQLQNFAFTVAKISRGMS
jgi:hypothetical protein